MTGIKAHCNHCGHTWIYTGNNRVTSCPVCGWRVRVQPPRSISTKEGDRILPDRKMDRLV